MERAIDLQIKFIVVAQFSIYTSEVLRGWCAFSCLQKGTSKSVIMALLPLLLRSASCCWQYFYITTLLQPKGGICDLSEIDGQLTTVAYSIFAFTKLLHAVRISARKANYNSRMHRTSIGPSRI